MARPPKQPKLLVDVQLDIPAYREMNLPCKMSKHWLTKKGKLFQPPKATMTADTGAQVDVINMRHLHQLGLSLARD